MIFNVTQELINESRELLITEWRKASFCPVALCVQRTLKNDGIRVTGMSVIIYDENGVERKRHIAPPSVLKFVKRFDKGLPVEPFTFEMEVKE